MTTDNLSIYNYSMRIRYMIYYQWATLSAMWRVNKAQLKFFLCLCPDTPFLRFWLTLYIPLSHKRRSMHKTIIWDWTSFSILHCDTWKILYYLSLCEPSSWRTVPPHLPLQREDSSQQKFGNKETNKLLKLKLQFI